MALDARSLTPPEAKRHGIEVKQDGRRRSGFELLAHRGVDIAGLAAVWPELGGLAAGIASQIEVDAQYSAYIERQNGDVETLRADEAVVVPPDFVYAALPGLSIELQQKLARHRPATIAAAGRIDGMTPAALLLVLAHIRDGGRKSAAAAARNA